jgi:hypothetical protein
MSTDKTNLPPHPLPPVMLSAQAKVAAFGREAELTLPEFAAWFGTTEEAVRKNLKSIKGVCQISQKLRAIHLGTFLQSQGIRH